MQPFDNNDPYAAFPGRPVAQPPQDLPHSGIGLTSFIFSMISLLGIITLIVIAAGMAARGGASPDDSATVALGGGALLLGLFNLLGVIFGIVGLVQQGRRKLFSILGLSINGALLLIFGGLMALGAAVS
jgi:hypothetical protein